jgi:hypothetical protein
MGWEEFWDCKGQLMIIAAAKLYLCFIVGMGEGDEFAHQGVSRVSRPGRSMHCYYSALRISNALQIGPDY